MGREAADLRAASRMISQSDLKEKTAEPLTMADVEALSDPAQVAHVVAVAPTYSVNSVRTVVRDQNTAESVSITGVTPEYESVRNMTPETGQLHQPGTGRSEGAGGRVGLRSGRQVV